MTRARWRREIAEAEAEVRRLDRMEKRAPRAFALSQRIDAALSACRRHGYPDQVRLLENVSIAVSHFCERGEELTLLNEADITKRLEYAEWLCRSAEVGRPIHHHEERRA